MTGADHCTYDICKSMLVNFDFHNFTFQRTCKGIMRYVLHLLVKVSRCNFSLAIKKKNNNKADNFNNALVKRRMIVDDSFRTYVSSTFH